MFNTRPEITIAATNKFLQLCCDPQNETLRREYAELERQEREWLNEQTGKETRYAAVEAV